MNQKCLTVGEAGPGELFPPVCNEDRGHVGMHATKWLNVGGKPCERTRWSDSGTIADLCTEDVA